MDKGWDHIGAMLGMLQPFCPSIFGFESTVKELIEIAEQIVLIALGHQADKVANTALTLSAGLPEIA